MKKLFTLLSLIIAGFASNAQICENWNTYDSLTATSTYDGWTLNYFSHFSYYTSVQSSGPSGPNSYKFGVDSATLITPDLTGYDSISFWMKGNATTGGTLANGAFYISETSDGISYTPIATINPIPAGVSSVQSYILSPGTTHVMFFYDKDSGNVAFDDFCATTRITGISETSANSFSLFPNPTHGIVNIKTGNPKNGICIVTDMIGNELKRYPTKSNEYSSTIDMSDFQDGIYLIKMKSEAGETTRRIVVRK